MNLTEDLRERYSRLILINDFGEKSMKQILDTRVVMVGAGGLGSACLRLLAAIGFGKIRIIDSDVVELSNIQRQTLYNDRDIGKSKAYTAAKNLEAFNPNVDYEPVSEKIDENNADRLLDKFDVIVDGLDSFESRKVVNKVSVDKRIPYVFAGAVEYYSNLSTFIPGKTGCLHCLMGDAKDNPENTAAVLGVTPTLLSMVGGIQVQEAIRVATDTHPVLAGRLMTVDISTLSFDSFKIGRDMSCPVCGD